MIGRSILLTALCALLAGAAQASWYWPDAWRPSGSDGGKKDPPRMSELMEPASRAIDKATDFIGEGKVDEAVEQYREALKLLERLETDHPERAATPEFQSVRNKRAYVDAQLNAILLEEARLNAKAVAVTDTTDLEEKLRRKRQSEKAGKAGKAEPKSGAARPATPKLESQLDEYMDDERARAKAISRKAAAVRFERENEEAIAELLKKDPESRRARILRAGLELYRKNYGSARKDLEALLAKDPSDVSALNLLAAVEAATGDSAAAEASLAKAIRARKDDHHAYYNLAKLLLKRGGGADRERAKRLYQSGRREENEDGSRGPCGPVDPFLEKEFK